MTEKDKLPEIMQTLSKQMGREPEPTVTRLEDYAPKQPAVVILAKALQIDDGLTEAINELELVLAAVNERLDSHATKLERVQRLVQAVKEQFI